MLRAVVCFVGLLGGIWAGSQSPSGHPAVVLTIVDENGSPVERAEVVVQEPGKASARITTDYNGRGTFVIARCVKVMFRISPPSFI